MKNLFIIVLLAVAFALGGCATSTEYSVNPLEQISQALDPYIETLALDWPKASGLIRGGLDPACLPQNIVQRLDKIDSWWKDTKGNWIPANKIKLNKYQEYYIAGVRLGHTGPVLQAIIKQYAPGLLGLPQVAAALAFLGLGPL